MYDFYEKLLKEKGVTTADVSKATGISQSVFANWKKRRGGLNIKIATKIAEYFDITVTELVNGHRTRAYDLSPIISSIHQSYDDALDAESVMIARAYSEAPEAIKEAVAKLLDVKRALPASKEA